jgi:peptidoglycan hydrolase CwlO-like protein
MGAVHPPRRRVRRASVALASALLLVPVLPTLAAFASDAGASADASAPPNLADAKARLAELRDRIAAEQGAVEQRQTDIAAIAGRLENERAAYDATQARLWRAREALASLEQQHAALRERLDERAVQALYLQSGPQMEFLLESASFAEISDRIEFLNQLQVADAALARRVAETARRLAATRDGLEDELHRRAEIVSSLDAQQNEIAALLADQQDRLERIALARHEAGDLVEELVSDRQRRQARRARRIRTAALGGAVAPYGQWAKVFLAEIGAPTCHDNLVAVVAWQAAEGTQASWNPLATTLRLPGSTAFNAVGVQNYDSLAQGVAAAHQTLLRGAVSYGYGAIIEALQRCADAIETARAINASLWCRGCTGGAYVTGLIPAVEAYFDRYASASAA